jgi:hypothetical protein
MRPWQAGVVLLLAFGATTSLAADSGVYTLVNGDVRLLRGTMWYRLESGVRAESGDIVDVGQRGQAQIELARGGTLMIQGPAVAYAVALPAAADKGGGVAELVVQQGWFKAAVAARQRPLRLRLRSATLDVENGIVVVRDNAPDLEVFVEKGSAGVTPVVARGKETPRKASEGEFWKRSGDRAFVTEDRPPSAFIAAVPRDLRDALPSLASRYAGAAPVPVAGREVTFAEAEPWLSGAWRKGFARRFSPRLSDPAFRAAAAAAHPIPEWDRTLHPEKYVPKDADTAQEGAGVRR